MDFCRTRRGHTYISFPAHASTVGPIGGVGAETTERPVANADGFNVNDNWILIDRDCLVACGIAGPNSKSERRIEHRGKGIANRMNYGARPLRRSVNDRVCGGLAEYLDLDPTVVRIAYVLLSILSAAFPGTLVYLILWILIPSRDFYE
jgi:phage shock protein C